MNGHVIAWSVSVWRCTCGNEYGRYDSVLNHRRKNGGLIQPIKRPAA